MPDIVLTCQNCQSPFVYSEFEQLRDQKNQTPTPKYCQICSAIKQAEQKHPPKPTTKS